MMSRILIAVVVMTGALVAVAQNQPGGAGGAAPTTQPTRTSDPDQMLKQLLTPARPTVRPLEPVPDAQAFDRISTMAVGAKPEPRPLVREGEIIPQRVGRLTRTAEGQPEFTFDADAQTFQDPPMIILPNQKLEQMENRSKDMARDLRFRISGIVTEYRGRNYILIETVSILSEPAVR
jgi:hypothetical protein